MYLPGRLQSTTLGDVLGELHRHKVSGILELIEDRSIPQGRRHAIHLQRGVITHVETAASVPRIGEVLARNGVLSGTQTLGLEHILRRRPGALAGSVLLEGGIVNDRILMTALADQLKMRVDAVFGVRDAAMRFHAGRPRSTHSLPVSEYLHGRPRKRDMQGEQPRGREQQSEPAVHAGDTAIAQRQKALAELGLGPDASRAEVRHAFRRLASAVHPDLHPVDDPKQRQAVHSRFAELSAAYHFLITH